MPVIRTYWIIASLLSVALSACGGSGSSDDNPNAGAPTPTPAPTIVVSPTPSPTPSASPNPSSTPEPTPVIGPSGFGLSSSAPAANAQNRALISEITLEFTKPLVPATVTDDTLKVSAPSTDVPVEIYYADGSQTITLATDQPLEPSTRYTVSLNSALMSRDGESMPAHSFSFTTAGRVGTTPQDIIDSCMTLVDLDMLNAVNAARSTPTDCGSEGFFDAAPHLSWHCTLASAAIDHNQDMADNNFVEHTGSDGSDPGDRIERLGYQPRSWAENIAAGQANVVEVMDGWLSSDGHCRNIMSPSNTELGAAFLEPNNARYRTYWTQVFGAPR